MDINLNKVYHVYFLGIGGIGMSALARYFLSQRIAVSGYDLTPSSMTKALEQEGVDIHYREAIELIPPKITQEKEFSLEEETEEPYGYNHISNNLGKHVRCVNSRVINTHYII